MRYLDSPKHLVVTSSDHIADKEKGLKHARDVKQERQVEPGTPG